MHVRALDDVALWSKWAKMRLEANERYSTRLISGHRRSSYTVNQDRGPFCSAIDTVVFDPFALDETHREHVETQIRTSMKGL